MKNKTNCGKMPKVSRRQLLKFTLGVSLGGSAGLLGAPVAAAEQATCADLEDIFSLYESLNYSEVSTVEGKACGNCSFFDPNSEEDCRHCEMMGAPTNITGHCDSWATIEEDNDS